MSISVGGAQHTGGACVGSNHKEHGGSPIGGSYCANEQLNKRHHFP